MSLLMKALQKAAESREQQMEMPRLPLNPPDRPGTGEGQDIFAADSMPRENPLLASLRDRPLAWLGGAALLALIGWIGYVYLALTALDSPAAPPRAATPPVARDEPAAAPQPAPTPVARMEPAVLPQSAPVPALKTATAGGSEEARQKENPPPAAPPVPQPAPEGITVSRSGTAEEAPAALAYQAFSRGDYETARSRYQALLAEEPRNVDALLGLAAVARQQGRAEEAGALYLKAIELDPRNSAAQAGLIGLLGRADPPAAEAKLKQLIVRDPSAFLYFTLGNLYAEQQQWQPAQAAYFEAHRLQPDNPDYAFNLAVGLEHLGQRRLAADYYREALQLAATQGRANFDAAQVRQRLAQIEAERE